MNQPATRLAEPVTIGGRRVGRGQPLFVIAGPCVLEDPDEMLRVATHMAETCRELGLGYCFKASYAKDNRTSGGSYRGPGAEAGLALLERIGREAGVPVLTDIHRPEEAAAAGAVAEVLQIPAFLCRQTDLLVAAARTGRCVNVKKGQFLAPWDMRNVVDKITASGNEQVMLTERGTSFGYNTLVVDMRGLAIQRSLGVPVVFDATHSVQEPGGLGSASGGKREFVPTLTRAAVAAGVDALFLEVHPNPEQGLSDGPNMWPLDRLGELLAQARDLDALARAWK